MTQETPTGDGAEEQTGEAAAAPEARLQRPLSTRDRAVVIAMVTIPTVLVVGLVWLPAMGSVVLSFADWSGIGGLDTIQWVGTKNYHDIATIYPPFWPAIRHNVIWLVFLFVGPTILGILLAVSSTGRSAGAGSTRPPSSCRWSSPWR